MDFSNGQNSNADTAPFSNRQPWVWIVIPLIVVLCVGALACACHTVRMRRRKKRNMIVLDPNARQALERDLEEALSRGEGARVARPREGRRWVQPTSRWAWVTSGDNGSGAGMASRSNEGLNELGEAPPPYVGRNADEEPKDEAAGVELHDLGEGTSRSASRQEQVAGDREPSAPRPPTATQPPTYDSVTGAGPGPVPAVAQPPPAVLSPDNRAPPYRYS